MGIVQRHKKVAFMGVKGENGTIVYTRMQKFTSLTQNKNSIEYSRQYVDEPFNRTDVMGYGPTIDYAFDKHTADTVQTDIINITDKELMGDDAVRTIVIVDLSAAEPTAIKRDYSIIPSSEGDNINVYTYSGSFKARGAAEACASVTSSDEYQNISIT